MRVVFLDIDGVLNCYAHDPLEEIYSKMKKRGWHTFSECWCPREAQTKRLLEILYAFPDTYLVISSTWRNKMTSTMWDCLLYACGGFTRPARMCWAAPVTPKLWKPRGLEIQAWLSAWPESFYKSAQNQGKPVPQIESFVILDDASDMEHLLPYLVHVNGEVGLQDTDVERAIQILQGPLDTVS